MNLFVLDLDPVKAAYQVCDKHVVKMPLETAQILCTVAHTQGFSPPYKKTHVKHPCTIWAGASRQSFYWTVMHGLALCDAYSERYGKIHACRSVIEDVASLPLTFARFSMPPFAQAMPEKYRGSDVVEAYRRYYIGDKAGIATWKSPSKIPDWFVKC